MGRKPVGKRAMTDAERQRRRRKKVRQEKIKLGCKALRERKLLEAAEKYIPAPPGVTYWYRVRMRTAAGEEVLMWQPTTKPLPAMRWNELEDEELVELWDRLNREIKGRAATGKRGAGNVAGLRHCGTEILSAPK